MEPMYWFPMIPHSWRFALAFARFLLAAAMLGVYSLATRNLASIPGVCLLGYVAIAGVVLWARPILTDRRALALVILDTFIASLWAAIYSGAIGSVTLWYGVAAASWTLTLAYAGITQRALTSGIVTGVALLLMLQVPKARETFLPFLIGGLGALVWAWAQQKTFYEERLHTMAQQNVLLRADAIKSRHEERVRIAADFHDGPLQSFIGFLFRLELLKRIVGKDIAAGLDELEQLQELCKQQVNELRAFVRSMRPLEVEGSSLAASLSRMVDQFQKDSGISSTFSSGDIEEPQETETGLEILQIVREALNNIRKHSHATRVIVSVAQSNSSVEVSVDDNGAGFPFAGQFSLDELDTMRLGPASIKRRVKSIGADLTLESKPGEGTRLMVRVAA